VKHFILLFILFNTYQSVISQETKTYTTSFTTSKIKIDALIEYNEWKSAETTTGFIQNAPIAGEPATQKTIVKVLYDNDAIYICAELFEISTDSITQTLSNRDDFGNADNFGVIFDTYNNATIGFAFIVTSAGVQIDALWGGDRPDFNWNAVWESKAKVYKNKWIVEMRIPYSALRFPNQPIQDWNINFSRSIRRNREESFWNFFDPKGANLLSQLGKLEGVKDIKSPVRLSFSPYVSAYLENYDHKNSYNINGGMDLKYGINDAFTIDMTLIPDFGQVKFDEQVLNLSPFEIKFNENRQFFTEGTDLFNKNDLFYSRRIGSSPINQFNIDKAENEIVLSSPNTTPLLNATKLSGRTKKGLGIGVFNGITRVTSAILLDTITNLERESETSPITNYNVFVLDQNLKNNSSVTFTNASTWRVGNTYDANVSALSTVLYNKANSYQISSNIKLSQKYSAINLFGGSGEVAFHKSSGQFKWGSHIGITDDKFDPNDLGFLRRNNRKTLTIHSSYDTYKPFWRFYKTSTELSFNYSKLFNPNVFTLAELRAEYNTTFKNFLSSGVWLSLKSNNYDYFEPRTTGRFYLIPKSLNTGYYYSSNYAKKFALDVSPKLTVYNSNRLDYSVRISPRIRLSDKLNIIYGLNYEVSVNEKGLAYSNTNDFFYVNDNPIFGQRQKQIIINSFEANYIFTNRMGLSFKLRHYWANVEYDKFYTLNTSGTLDDYPNYSGTDANNSSIHNNNFNAFTIDMSYKWVFAPGSQLSLVWKNSIFSSTNDINFTYIENTQELANSLATNSLSFKLLYYLDYATIFKKKSHE